MLGVILLAQWFITPSPAPACTEVWRNGECVYWYWDDSPEFPNPCTVEEIDVVPERCYVSESCSDSTLVDGSVHNPDIGER